MYVCTVNRPMWFSEPFATPEHHLLGELDDSSSFRSILTFSGVLMGTATPFLILHVFVHVLNASAVMHQTRLVQ